MASADRGIVQPPTPSPVIEPRPRDTHPPNLNHHPDIFPIPSTKKVPLKIIDVQVPSNKILVPCGMPLASHQPPPEQGRNQGIFFGQAKTMGGHNLPPG